MDHRVKGDERKTSFGAAESRVGTETDKRSPVGIQCRDEAPFYKALMPTDGRRPEYPGQPRLADMFESIVFSQYARVARRKVHYIFN